MPTYDYQCDSCQSVKSYIRKVDERDDPVNCECGTEKLMKRTISAHGGYHIKGNNSASERPRGAGSFNGKKKS